MLSDVSLTYNKGDGKMVSHINIHTSCIIIKWIRADQLYKFRSKRNRSKSRSAEEEEQECRRGGAGVQKRRIRSAAGWEEECRRVGGGGVQQQQQH